MKEVDNDHHKHTTISHTQTHTKCQVIINAIKKKKQNLNTDTVFLTLVFQCLSQSLAQLRHLHDF